MKEWFKARNIWGAAIKSLEDESAGKLAKAIWAFTMAGEIAEVDEAGKAIFAMILMTLESDEERDAEISVKRSKATDSIRNQKASKDIKSNQMISSDIKSDQMISSDDNKNKNKNIDKEQESESESYIGDDEARKIQTEQNRVLDAAEDAGFKMSNDVRAALIALYADSGLSKMLDGIKSCSEHGAANLAYLRAVLKGKPKTIKSHGFEQRDYSAVSGEIREQQDKDIEAFMRGAV